MGEQLHGVRAIRAAYELQYDERAWLREVANELTRMIGDNHGMIACGYRRSADGWHLWGFEFSAPCGPELADRLVALGTRPEVAIVHQLLPSTDAVQCASVRRSGLFERSELRALFGHHIQDLIYMAVPASGHEGCLFLWPQTLHRRLTARTTRSWRRVLEHIQAGLRLRRVDWQDMARGFVASLPDAQRAGVLASMTANSGHADSARGRLRRVASAIDTIDVVGGPTRSTDIIRAQAVYRGLLTGEWALIDHYCDRDEDTRYVIARWVEPDARTPLRLSPAELEVMTLFLTMASNGALQATIADAENLSHSRVYKHGSTARSKMGIRNMAELFAVLRVEWTE